MTVQVRDWLCPVNRRWPLAVLLGALARDYPRRANGAASRHFVLIEYVMLSGVNDTVADAHRSVERPGGPAAPSYAVPLQPRTLTKLATYLVVN
jgi:23S rRNA (adenine2503-C2)-methyltransferase